MEQSKSIATLHVQNKKLSLDDGEDKVIATVFRSLVGSLLYLIATKPHHMFPTSLSSRFMHTPRQAHLNVARRVLRYIKGTTDFGVWYEKETNGNL